MGTDPIARAPCFAYCKEQITAKLGRPMAWHAMSTTFESPAALKIHVLLDLSVPNHDSLRIPQSLLQPSLLLAHLYISPPSVSFSALYRRLIPTPNTKHQTISTLFKMRAATVAFAFAATAFALDDSSMFDDATAPQGNVESGSESHLNRV